MSRAPPGQRETVTYTNNKKEKTVTLYFGKEDGNETKLCRIPLKRSEEWTEVSAEIIPEALSEVLQENSPGIWQEEPKGQIGTLLFTYHGSGSMEFLEFSLN